MAIVLLAIDGQGLGHLIRSSVVSAALASVGERPVIFSGGEYRTLGLEQFPDRTVPALWGAPDEVRKRVALELYSMAVISRPSVLVEDTHPAPIELPPGIRRVLLVRPTSFEYMVRLNERHGERFAAFLLCDSPESPTWPYDEAQTRQVAGWKNWRTIGPVYRAASEEAVRKVRERYHVDGDRDICVFSMGGGATKVHDQQGQDYVRFLRLASEVSDLIEASGSRPRLLFVKGPYFQRRFPIPPRFEVVAEEGEMPALLKIARGAVIRAGFNTAWECIAAGTPFLPLIGTTYAEPVLERVNRMQSAGLVPPDIESFWFRDEWRAEYRRKAKNIVAKHSGVPEPRKLSRLILGRREARWARRSQSRAVRPITEKPEIPLVIRIDDVIREERALCWLLDLLAARRLRASLEVIPYLLQFDEAFLQRFDPSGELFEISQHGYAHVPCTSSSGRQCEFIPESVAPTMEEAEGIARGKRQLEMAFPNRFTGGFSPPFDVMPAWLPANWHSVGGSFVSCVYTRPCSNAPVPVKRAGVEVWDWAENRPINQERITYKLKLQYAVDGSAGLVLHPHCLRRQSDRVHLRTLLDSLEGSVHTVSLRDIAVGDVETVRPRPQTDPFWFLR